MEISGMAHYVVSSKDVGVKGSSESRVRGRCDEVSETAGTFPNRVGTRTDIPRHFVTERPARVVTGRRN